LETNNVDHDENGVEEEADKGKEDQPLENLHIKAKILNGVTNPGAGFE